MLPTHGPISPGQIDHVRTQLARFIGANHEKLPQIAKKIGCRPDALLKFMDDKYDGVLDDFARRINRWIVQQDRTGGAGLPAEMVKTSVTDRMRAVCHQTQQLRSMAAIVGPSGVGKTLVLKALEAGIIPGSKHIEFSATDKSPTGLIRRIAFELGGPSRYRMQESFAWIINHLTTTDAMLLLDEAHYLGEPALNIVRDIHKRTGCPIVLVGTQDLLDTVNDFNQFHGQFKRLISLVYNITEELAATGDPLYTVDEVMRYASAMGLRLTLDAADETTGLANLLGWGGLGALGFLLINANTLATVEAKQSGSDLSRLHIHPKHINAALRQMEGASGLDRVKRRIAGPTRKVATA